MNEVYMIVFYESIEILLQQIEISCIILAKKLDFNIERYSNRFRFINVIQSD